MCKYSFSHFSRIDALTQRIAGQELAVGKTGDEDVNEQSGQNLLLSAVSLEVLLPAANAQSTHIVERRSAD